MRFTHCQCLQICGLHSEVSTTSDLNKYNKYLESYLGNVTLCGRTYVCFS